MKKMARGFLPKSFVVLFVFAGWFFWEGLVSVGGASEDIQEETTTKVTELEYEELFDWLTGLEAKGVISGEEFEDILDRVTTKPGPYTLTTTTVTICGKRGMTGSTCTSGTPSTSCSSLWSSAGTVSTGNPILITASGTIVYDTAGKSTGPAGSGSGCSVNHPLFCATAHSLVAFIGPSSICTQAGGFQVGSAFYGAAYINGTLWLTHNDGFVQSGRTALDVGGNNDNSGYFTATVTIIK